jgi:hypothetical protein
MYKDVEDFRKVIAQIKTQIQTEEVQKALGEFAELIKLLSQPLLDAGLSEELVSCIAYDIIRTEFLGQ